MSRLLLFIVLCVSVVSWQPDSFAGGPLKVTALGKINTDKDETDPFLASDNKTLLFATDRDGTWDVYASKRNPSRLQWNDSDPLSTNTKDADERSPLFQPGKYVYFSSNRVPDPAFKDLKNFDIYQQSGPRAPSAMLRVSTGADEMYPWVASKEKEFYFNRKTDDGFRLFVSKGPALGPADEGTLVKEIPAGFVHPTITPDGKTMYLQGPLEGGKTGIPGSHLVGMPPTTTKPGLVSSEGTSHPFICSIPTYPRAFAHCYLTPG